MRIFGRTLISHFCALFIASLFLPISIAGPITPYTIKLESSSLSDALIAVAQQTGVSIVFSTKKSTHIDEAFNKTINPIAKMLTLKEILEILLLDTNLEAHYINDGLVAIKTQSQATGNIATASDSPNNLPSVEQLNVIGQVLTGSRIKSTDFSGSAPVDIISSFDIELAGAQSVGELLRNLPSVVGNSTSTAISNGGDGTATVTLRGLPANNTLVLLNGRRVAQNGFGGEAFDLNSLSPASIDRIEVLKSGASAVYGSDAIAGVINIIMKEKQDGVQLDSYYGSSSRQDLETSTTHFSFGKTFDRGDIFISGTYYDQNGILSRDRAVSASADTRLFGGSDKRSSATPNARFEVQPNQVLTLKAGQGNSQTLLPSSFRTATDEDKFNFLDFTSATVPSRRSSLYSSFSYDLSGKLSTFIEYSLTQSSASALLAPTPIFTAFESIPLTISASNIYNPFNRDIFDARKRVVELGPRKFVNKSDAERFAWGLEGQSKGIDWNLTWHWSQTKAKEITYGLLDANKLQQALGPSELCTQASDITCVPFNIFSEAGSLPQEQLSYVATSSKSEGFTKLYGAILNSSFKLGELPTGPVLAAAGIEYRNESIAMRPVDASLVTIGGTNFEASQGRREISEVYVETMAPLISDAKGKAIMNFEVAVRHSHYSDFGDSTNPRLALTYKPVKALMLRASYATGFRAPSLTELYQANKESQAFLTDPCSIDSETTPPFCIDLTDDSRLQFLTLKGGNIELTAEKSEHFNVGLFWTYGKKSQIEASLDLFRIQQHNVIDANAQFVLDQNAINGSYPNRVIRDNNGEILQINATNINIGRRTVDGVDFALRYAFPKLLENGRLHFSLNGSYIDSYKEQLAPSLPTLQLVGSFADEASAGRGAIPKWKLNLGAYWKYKRWQASLSSNYIDSIQEFISGEEKEQREIASWITHDIQLNFLSSLAGGIRFTLGANNIADNDAPFAASAFNDNIDARTHSLTGRYYYARVTKTL